MRSLNPFQASVSNDELPGEQEMKWMLRAAITFDPGTLTKNLATFTAVAFSATVLYVMFSKIKRPQYHHMESQVSLSVDEDTSDEDHTSQCEVLSPTSIVGCRNESLEPDNVMSLGFLIEDIEPSRRLDSSVRVNTFTEGLESENLTIIGISDLEIQSSTATTASSSGAAYVDRSAGRLYSNTAETKKLTSNMTPLKNPSSDFTMVSEAIIDRNLVRSGDWGSQIQPSSSAESGPGSSDDINEAAVKLADLSVCEIPLI